MRNAITTAMATAVFLAAVGCQESRPAAAPPGQGPVEAARSALRAGQNDAAIADADDYLRGQPRGPDAAEAGYIKGKAFYQKGSGADPVEVRRDLFEARAAYLLALNARPSSVLEGYIRADLSTVALYQDDFPTAIEQATAALPLVDGPPTKAAVQYNVGLAQQRLSRFGDADQTFRQIQQLYPGTISAAKAAQHLGQRLFYVQLATYAAQSDADRATASVRAGGSVVSSRSDAQGHTVLDVGPYSTYAAAKQQLTSMSASFPTAVIVPP